jgi:hypothetical protein
VVSDDVTDLFHNSLGSCFVGFIQFQRLRQVTFLFI